MDQSIARLLDGRHHDPFSLLGRHPLGEGWSCVRALLPQAASVRVGPQGPAMECIDPRGLWQWEGPDGDLPRHHSLHCTDQHGHTFELIDPYTFEPQLGELDMYLFGEGRHWHVYRVLGAHPHQVDGIDGVLFAVWAPNAERVSVVGDFNQWDGRRNMMRSRGGGGLWELFIPGLVPGDLYKYELRNRDSGTILLKTDPYGGEFELRPGTAARVPAPSTHAWSDGTWMQSRGQEGWLNRPMSIYEVHLGSWRRREDGGFLDYRTLAHQLVDYVKPLGFTHVELLPITEHPLDDSWGYQTTGYFAPTSRFGTPDDFRYFVDYLHQNDVGVLLDWAPGHFPKDEWALARFDGTPLYEHADPRRGEHRDWGTYIFNYGRNEVRNFLLASAVHWLEEYHIDGLRVDAVASMLYLDYSRDPHDWLPNQYGGRENLEAIEFLRELNRIVHGRFPGAVVIAEESTAWPGVTKPTDAGGLGFTMKWNMGWMHDTLGYMARDPIHRQHHHNDLTFGLLYAFSENFVLPLSHDEVVHGKGSLVGKMAGDEWQRFANLRLLYSMMWTYPGKKLLFMGGEFGQVAEWAFGRELEWWVLQYPLHAGVQRLIGDLNRLYRRLPALHVRDFDWNGFRWIDCGDAAQSVLSYLRQDSERKVVVVLNFTPLPREDYRVGVPAPGRYRVLLNTDAAFYGGSNIGPTAAEAEATGWNGLPFSIRLTLPPLGALILQTE
ncbi:1,4-alpha-glucan branching protein GlgB [Thiofaba sp. EF100]|uniref:1,4-alpha-glucan branching protein GlgB n=1 Tax=Thiofaba sp. EF100 TaxID=3121274 RepID=UPI0032218713